MECALRSSEPATDTATCRAARPGRQFRHWLHLPPADRFGDYPHWSGSDAVSVLSSALATATHLPTTPSTSMDAAARWQCILAGNLLDLAPGPATVARPAVTTAARDLSIFHSRRWQQNLAGACEWRVYHAPVMQTGTDSPGVHFPPPLFYAGAVIAGWLLDRPWTLPINGAWRTLLGWVFVAGWALLAASAIGMFRRKQTSMITFRPAGTLVTSGPYAFTRNPMYVSLVILTIAFALLLNTWWIVLLLVPTVLMVQKFVIVPEERYLQRRFDGEYEAYTRRVRRWL